MEADTNQGVTYRSKAAARKALYSDRRSVKTPKSDGEPIFAKVLYIIAITSFFFGIFAYTKLFWRDEAGQFDAYFASAALIGGFFQCVLFTFLGRVIVYLHRIAMNKE